MFAFYVIRVKVMAYQDKAIKFFDNFAKKLKPTHTVMAIATVKGICRPTFTMMDKTEKPETKRYTALREGLTEAIAIPVYWACGEFAGYGAKVLEKLNNKKAINKAKQLADKTGDIVDIEKLKQPAHVTEKIAHNLRFLGVCIAALFVIPATCSIVIKPVVEKIVKPPKPENKSSMPDFNTAQSPIKPITRPSMNSFISNHGLRVGGV